MLKDQPFKARSAAGAAWQHQARERNAAAAQIEDVLRCCDACATSEWTLRPILSVVQAVEDLQREAHTLKDQLSSAMSALSQLQEQHSREKLAGDAAAAQNEELQGRCEELESRLKDARSALSQLQEQHSREKLAGDTAAAQKEELEGRCEELERRLKDASSDLSQLQEQHSREKLAGDTAAAQKEELSGCCEELKRRLDGATAQREATAAEMRKIQSNAAAVSHFSAKYYDHLVRDILLSVSFSG